MIYLVQRLILNYSGWLRPSPGRLGRFGEGQYVKENGFGNEDWNFNTKMVVGGYVYGYFCHNPAAEKAGDQFEIACAVYRQGQWRLVGFYRKAHYVPNGSPQKLSVIRAKADDLAVLKERNSLGSAWTRLSRDRVITSLAQSVGEMRWRVRPENVIALGEEVPIPRKVFNSSNRRLVRPTETDEKTFRALLGLVSRRRTADELEDPGYFPEGREVERIHRTRERNPQVIAIAKKRFLSVNGRFSCEACGFDFEKTYGPIGREFIEAHHTIPVSDLKRTQKTHPKDISMVCSNCHRMLHVRRPWLRVMDIRRLLTQQ